MFALLRHAACLLAILLFALVDADSVTGLDLAISSVQQNQIARFNITTGIPKPNLIFDGSVNVLNGPTFLEFAPNGLLFVSSLNNNLILQYNISNPGAPPTPLEISSVSLKQPQGLMFDTVHGYLFIASQFSGTIVVVQLSDFSYVGEIQALHEPADLRLDAEHGMFYVLQQTGDVAMLQCPLASIPGEFPRRWNCYPYITTVYSAPNQTYQAQSFCLSPNRTQMFISVAGLAGDGTFSDGLIVRYDMGGSVGTNMVVYIDLYTLGSIVPVGLRYRNNGVLYAVAAQFRDTAYDNTTIEVYGVVTVNATSGPTTNFTILINDTLPGAFAIAFSPGDDTYLAMSCFDFNSVELYSSVSGAHVAQIANGTVGTGPLPLNGPRAIKYRPEDGYLYVTSTGTHEIYRFKDDTGELFIPYQPNALVELLAPWGLDFYENQMYVSSHGSDAVLMYNIDPSSRNATLFAFYNVIDPAGLVVDQLSGNFYVASFEGHAIYFVNQTAGMYSTYVSDQNVFFSYLAVVEDGIIAVDKYESAVYYYPGLAVGGNPQTFNAFVNNPIGVLAVNASMPFEQAVIFVVSSQAAQVFEFVGSIYRTSLLCTSGTCTPSTLQMTDLALVPPYNVAVSVNFVLIIVMSVAACIVGGLLVLVLSLWCYAIQQKRKNAVGMRTLDVASSYIELPDTVTRSYADSPILRRSVQEGWNIPPSELQMERMIARGASGEVWSARWKRQVVAVKKLFVFNHKDAAALFKEFVTECSTMCKLRHQNVCQFLGASIAPPALCLITEFMPRGSLFDVLHDASIPLTWLQRLRMARDTAAGMLYLHSLNPPVIHRDLKTPNLLVDDHFTVKVADFGASRVKADSATMTSIGTPAWTAPEVLRNTRYSEKADVYSFGVVLWEIYTRAQLYPDTETMQVVLGVLNEMRPAIPVDMPEKYRDLMTRCWQSDCEARPEFGEIIDTIDELIREETVSPSQQK
eukprot:TRINITY_DN15117_c0_g1_i1.p1 TRINITY_DN15117_c0_g1~~TRINITY_DN15117_c0_g1_i1.p1  ORF type:complete len:969 (-),score=229.55 TRINITY_DN15117_c0_g1_i1:6-2912(-)